MDIMLSGGSEESQLLDVYDRAIREAVELMVVSAYLTDWAPRERLSDQADLTFVVGTDFGLTRKAACRAVLNWLPPRLKSDFLAADHITKGFHPKLVAWRTATDQFRILLGSSNITEAGFSSNYEANIVAEATREEFERIGVWVDHIRDLSSPISEDWLRSYRECRLVARPWNGRHASRLERERAPVVKFDVPSGKAVEAAVQRRRNQTTTFVDIQDDLGALIEECARGSISNEHFYEKMYSLWGNHTSRFQGRGFEIAGKHEDWQAVCAAIVRIRGAGASPRAKKLDDVVKDEIDSLTRSKNANRGSWLTEMLCHFFPDKYPSLNRPVLDWLKFNKYRWQRGASKGAQYVDLALKLRQEVRKRPANGAVNLAEFDHAIWQWSHDRQGRS
jgi:hypothetical protein